jgi:hypothetical protein
MNLRENNKEKEPQFKSGQQMNRLEKGLYGLDPETSLLSINFAPKENPYLNEHFNGGEEDKSQN